MIVVDFIRGVARREYDSFLGKPLWLRLLIVVVVVGIIVAVFVSSPAKKPPTSHPEGPKASSPYKGAEVTSKLTACLATKHTKYRLASRVLAGTKVDVISVGNGKRTYTIDVSDGATANNAVIAAEQGVGQQLRASHVYGTVIVSVFSSASRVGSTTLSCVRT